MQFLVLCMALSATPTDDWMLGIAPNIEPIVDMEDNERRAAGGYDMLVVFCGGDLARITFFLFGAYMGRAGRLTTA